MRISIRNDAMQTRDDLYHALTKAAEEVWNTAHTRQPIMDLNGNKVGEWVLHLKDGEI